MRLARNHRCPWPARDRSSQRVGSVVTFDLDYGSGEHGATPMPPHNAPFKSYEHLLRVAPVFALPPVLRAPSKYIKLCCNIQHRALQLRIGLAFSKSTGFAGARLPMFDIVQQCD